MSPAAPGFDVEGPVQAEVFVLYLAGGRPQLTGPCGAQPWYLEVGTGQDPMAVITDAVRRVLGPPLVVHSTSWRRARDAVILSFLAVVAVQAVAHLPHVAVDRADLARGDATAAPVAVATGQVLEHGLRHLAWLVHDDPAVAGQLAGAWTAVLAGYTPAPFRHL